MYCILFSLITLLLIWYHHLIPRILVKIDSFTKIIWQNTVCCFYIIFSNSYRIDVTSTNVLLLLSHLIFPLKGEKKNSGKKFFSVLNFSLKKNSLENLCLATIKRTSRFSPISLKEVLQCMHRSQHVLYIHEIPLSDLHNLWILPVPPFSFLMNSFYWSNKISHMTRSSCF